MRLFYYLFSFYRPQKANLHDIVYRGERRHGFESGEKFCERSEQNIFLTPHFFAKTLYVCGVDISVNA